VFNFFDEIKKKFKLENNVLDEFNIINLSGKALYIEGHNGLLKLSKEKISFKIKKKIIDVEGENMILKELTYNTILIQGDIKKTEIIWW